MEPDEFITKITREDLLDEFKTERVRSYLRRGTPTTISFKLSAFRKHLHNFLLHIIKEDYFYSDTLIDDIDPTYLVNIDTDLTPDLYDPDGKVWADVTITRDPSKAATSKFEKYKGLLIEDHTLFVYCFCLNTYELRTFAFDDNGLMNDLSGQLGVDSHNALVTGLSMYDSSRKFELLDTLETDEATRLMGELPEVEMCKEALEFYQNDDGFLAMLLEHNSVDSDPQKRDEFRKLRDLELKEMAKEISLTAKKTSTQFKCTDEEGIRKAFEMVEDSVAKNYVVLDKPKPSCHGMPGSMSKVSKVSDTRNMVVMKFDGLFKQAKHDVFQEISAAISRNVEELRPRKLQQIRNLKKEVLNLSVKAELLDEKEVVFDSPEDVFLKSYRHKKTLLKNLQNEQLWDRECLRVPKKGLVEKLMRIGKISKQKMEVKTVPFWEAEFSEPLKAEIMDKSNTFILEQNCWTPHKEWKPELKEAKPLYEKFIKSRLYQEIAQVGQLASNILRLSTKPRKYCSITTASNENMAAIVGPGDGVMNESNTVPIVWLSLGEEQKGLWMPPFVTEKNLHISNGDRLTKARLEQMVDAPRIASIAASIICCEMEGQPRNIMYACGVMASVAMSISIRDSELIDHIRYMVPNIFSERSCAEEYIKEKYNTPLKTGLQALIYQETKTTLLLSSQIVKKYHDVEIENDEVLAGGVKMSIPFLNCTVDSVFKLNGIVYTGFFSCKKGLHDPRVENKKMFDKICEYEHKNFKRNLVEASFEKNSYHYFDKKYVAYTMSDMVDNYSNDDGWRSKMTKMDNLKKPYELSTFGSLRSSLQTTHKIEKVRMIGVKSKLNSVKKKEKADQITECWDEIWSDNRTRVVDHFFDQETTILEEGISILKRNPESNFYATWDQKRQRTGRDREVFILDPNGKTFMHNVESLFKVVCEGVPHEMITLPGNKKILSMSAKGTQYFKKINELKAEETPFENVRMTADMTKWAPGDNACKFIYAIAALPFLKKNEKIWYINFLCTTLRKRIILNSITTEAVGHLASDNHVKDDEMWSRMLGVKKSANGRCKQFESNLLEIRFNWLMGVLNDTSSAVHAACAFFVKKILSEDYKVHHYEPDVHSDDAAADLVVTKKNKSSDLNLLDYFPALTTVNLSYACIKLSEKKTYLDKHRKEFVSEVDDNGILKSYWHKLAISCISGVSYIDFFRDLSEACSKIGSLIALGAPPSVYEVAISNVIDLTRETYSMQPAMWNDPLRFLPGNLTRKEIPLELGGSLDMNPILLPLVGMRYHTFKKMMENVLEASGCKTLEEITPEKEDMLKNIQGNLFCKVWIHTTEAAVKENLVFNNLDSGMIKFKQFAAFEKVKSLRVMETLEPYDKEYIDEYLDKDPTLIFRQASSIEEQQLKLAMMIRNPSWYSSATLQSQGALKLDRMFNVRSPCCAPILTPEDAVMEKGMKTIREAITEALKALQARRVNLNETLMLLRSMPLMCHLYNLEKIADFKPGGKRQLFPVQKESFIKDSLVESSVVGLLQYVYTGQTDLYLDNTNLETEVQLVKRYQKSLEGLGRVQQAVAIFRMFEQTKSFSSVFFVPSPRLKGHDAILGVLSNQYSDRRNFVPIKRYDPPKNMIYKELKMKGTMSLEDKCSELACFLMKICFNQDTAKEVFLQCYIDGFHVEEIIEKAKDSRKVAYPKALLGREEEINFSKPDEVIWLLPQAKSFPTWTGPFIAYMNIGTSRLPKGIIISGTDEMIENIALLSDVEDYADLKIHLNIFKSKMKWRGNLNKHLKTRMPEEIYSWSLVVNNYKGSFQVKLRQGIFGVPVTVYRKGLDQPRILFEELTPSSIKTSVLFRDCIFGSRVLNQRLTNHFHVESQARIGFVPFRYLWDECWFQISKGFPIQVDTMFVRNDEMSVYLFRPMVKKLNQLGYEYELMEEPVYTIEDILEGKKLRTEELTRRYFRVVKPWKQKDFNFYMSLAIHYGSTLSTWVSWMGALSGCSRKFSFYNWDEIVSRRGDPRGKYYFEHDYIGKLITEGKTPDLRENKKPYDPDQLKIDMWTRYKINGPWGDILDETED